LFMRSMGLNSFCATFLFLALIPQLLLSGQVADSSATKEGGTGKKIITSLVAPTLLIGAGIATMNDRGWYSSQDAYECIQKNYPDFHSQIDDYLLFIPALGVYGLNAAGYKGKNQFADRTIMYLVSITLAAGTTGIIKRSTNVLRPDGSDYHSFPSSHTTLAFVSATFLHEEYKSRTPWIGITGYTIATISGVLRMLNNEHWMSDVLVGAGIGILSTKAVYLLYPLVKEFIGSRGSNASRNELSNLSLIPYASPRHFGIFLRYNL
jgi:membrane-associated phospholipid phosphatase